MAHHDESESRRTDQVGCAGILFLLMLASVLLASFLTREGSASLLAAAPASTATNTPAVPTLAQVAATPSTQALAQITNTPTATNTSIPTITPTPTPTWTPSPSWTPTSTLLPPTKNPTATSTPFLLPQVRNNISFTVKVPILMYHYVSTPPDFEDDVRVKLSVEPSAFREQMRYLAENGYTTIDFYEMSQAIVGETELPEKPVILTFDDGHRDHYTEAFPILQEFGLKGNFFVVTEFVDLGYEAYMTWTMIREMAQAGHRIEPHTKTHPDLRGQSYDYLVYQILGSIQTLEYHIGYRPRFFAFPGGGYDDRAIQVLQELEIWGAVITLGGKWHGFSERYTWRRLRMRYTMPLPEFVDLVNPVDAIYGKPLDLAPTPTYTPFPTGINQP